MDQKSPSKNLEYYEKFFKELKLSLKKHSNKIKTTSIFIDKKEKNLTVKELIFLINILKYDAKPILNFLCNSAGFIILKKPDSSIMAEDIKEMLSEFQFHNGLLNVNFLKSIENLKITEDEKNELKDLLYNFRVALNNFEFSLDNYKTFKNI